MLNVSAFVVVHESVEELPVAIVVGLAVRVQVGAGGPGLLTVIVAEQVASPPEPTTVIVYFVVAVGVTLSEPVRPTEPIPWSIEALEAFAVFQESVELSPALIESGLALSSQVGRSGGGAGVWGARWRGRLDAARVRERDIDDARDEPKAHAHGDHGDHGQKAHDERADLLLFL
jgi:hypothetical protein